MHTTTVLTNGTCLDNNALAASAWSLDDDNDIKTTWAMPGSNLPCMLYSRLIEVDEDLDLDCTWSVNVTACLTRDIRKPYLYVDIVAEGCGTDFAVDEVCREAFEHAIETGVETDAIAAQAALIEWILTWYEDDWIGGLTYDMLCELERQRRGISDDDLAWQEPGGVSYGADYTAVRVYRAGADQFLVCYECASEPCEDDEEPNKPFAVITRAQYESVWIDPYNYSAAQKEFLEIARMI